MKEIDERTLLKVERGIVWYKLNRALQQKIDMVKSRYESGSMSEAETMRRIVEINDTLDYLKKTNKDMPTEEDIALYIKHKNQLLDNQANK